MNEQDENPKLSQSKYEQKLHELTKQRCENESRWTQLASEDWERIADEEHEKLQARICEEVETENAINEEEAKIPLIPLLHLPTKAESQMNESDSIFKSSKGDIRSTELKDSEPSKPLRLSEFNFQQVPNVLVNHVRDKKIKPIDVVVWIAFANHQRKKEYSWPSNSTIAAIVGRDVRSVNRSIIRLQNAGHLNRVGRTHYGTKKTYLNTRVGADSFVIQPIKQMPQEATNKTMSDASDTADADSLTHPEQLFSSNRESVPNHHKEIWSNDEFLSDPNYVPF